MKKLLVALLALAAIGTMVAAQNAPAAIGQVGMWNYGEVRLYNNAGNTNLGPGWVKGGLYNNMTLSYSGKNVTWTQTQEWDQDGALPTFRNFGATFKLFNGMAKLDVGKLRTGFEYRWTNFDAAGFSTRLANKDSGFGVRLYPMDGFSVGAFVPVPLADQAVGTTYGNTSFGASYAIKDMATVVASYKGNTGAKEFFVGADVKAVSGLGLKLGFLDKLDAKSMSVEANTSYTVSGIALQAYGDVNLATATTYGAKVDASYAVASTPFTVGANFSYDNGDAWIGNNGIGFSGYANMDVDGNTVGLAFPVTVISGVTAYNVNLNYTVSF